MIDFSEIQNFTQKETKQFISVCSRLLGSTFITRTVYKIDKNKVNDSDYYFLVHHYEAVREYLALTGWILCQEDYHGYFYVQNSNEVNRCKLKKTATAILLTLRILYDENEHTLGVDHDAVVTVRDVVSKITIDYKILSSRPNMEEVKDALTYFEGHNIIQKIDGKFKSQDCRFVIMPTVLTAVSAERLKAVVAVIRDEEKSNEKAEEAAAD